MNILYRIFKHMDYLQVLLGKVISMAKYTRLKK
jgi:hypothetical protein